MTLLDSIYCKLRFNSLLSIVSRELLIWPLQQCWCSPDHDASANLNDGWMLSGWQLKNHQCQIGQNAAGNWWECLGLTRPLAGAGVIPWWRSPVMSPDPANIITTLHNRCLGYCVLVCPCDANPPPGFTDQCTGHLVWLMTRGNHPHPHCTPSSLLSCHFRELFAWLYILTWSFDSSWR